MKIDPTGKVPILAKPETTRAEKASPKPPADQVKISGSAAGGATYGRVPIADRGPADSSPEVAMAQDARAQKLAEIRSRVESGAYNSRDMIEKVVDKLLSSWKLGSNKPDTSA